MCRTYGEQVAAELVGQAETAVPKPPCPAYHRHAASKTDSPSAASFSNDKVNVSSPISAMRSLDPRVGSPGSDALRRETIAGEGLR